MKPLDHTISGIILAAGASERMGSPKALLELPDGTTLLERQVRTLTDAGCVRTIVVVGAEASRIEGAHPDLDVTWAVNEGWESGQFSSLRMGIAEAMTEGNSGCVMLPVDAADISSEIAGSIIETALRNPHLDAVVPEYEERGGHPVYLSRKFMGRLAKIEISDESARLDLQIRESASTMRLPVNDPAVTRNINTHEEWKKYLSNKF